MTRDLAATAFSGPVFNLRHGDYRGSPRILGQGVLVRGDFTSRGNMASRPRSLILIVHFMIEV